MELADENFFARLKKHPALRERFESILDIAENTNGDCVKADDAEERVIEEVRKLGQTTLQDWADDQNTRQTKRMLEEMETSRAYKKKLHWHTTYGKIEVQEIVIKSLAKTYRPFSKRAEVKCREYSLPLQRVITDFGAENSFHHAVERIQEHYSIDIPVSAVSKVTEHHAQKMLENQTIQDEVPDREGIDIIVAQTDGSMVPIVEVDKSEKIDRRKTRTVKWKEARLCLTRVWNAITPIFRATMGSVDQVGDLLLDAAIESGMGRETKIHGIGDGAKWIREQFSRVFANQASYLLDFYHVCEYLSSAAKNISPNDSGQWYEKNKKRLKKNYYKNVLEDLGQRVEASHLPNEQAPIRVCLRYLASRQDQLDYQGALEADLPIGSGEIESSHRFVIQERLKLPGAWWTEEHAAAMLTLRVVRCNDKWADYWEKLRSREDELAMAA